MAVKEARPDAEEIQELGREGVAIIKRWLEATTFVECSYDAYDNAPDCTIVYRTGRKKFDLVGRYMVGKKHGVIVEAKRYTSVGGQYREFKQFLRIAYSATLEDIEAVGRDRKYHYFWITSHPFNLENWSRLESHDHMRSALEEDRSVLKDDDPIDDDLIREVASRVTVLVFNMKQKDLSLTKQELLTIRPYLARE